MKARIKATGEIAEFVTGKNLHGEIILQKIGTASIFSLNEVEPMPDIDWQHYRIQTAIAAMSIVADDGYNVRNEQHLIAKYTVQIADALVEELMKGGQDE